MGPPPPAFVLACLLALACSYDPHFRSGVITCQDSRVCPRGFVCATTAEGRLCVTPDQVPEGGAAPDVPTDTAAEPDAAIPLPDLPGPAPDAVAPDVATIGSAPEAGSSGCPSGRGPVMVSIEGRFCVDSTEVTNEQYAAFLAAPDKPAAGRLPPRCAANRLAPDDDLHWTVPPNGGRFPINYVDWCDAYTYCLWAGKRLCGKIGGQALAPDETGDFRVSQWARACSRGGDRPFPYGDTYDPARCDTGHLEDPVRTHEVGRATCEGGYPGLFDMSGNVQEWIDACQGSSCYMSGGSYAARNANGGEESHCQGSAYAEPHTNRWGASGFRCCAP